MGIIFGTESEKKNSKNEQKKITSKKCKEISLATISDLNLESQMPLPFKVFVAGPKENATQKRYINQLLDLDVSVSWNWAKELNQVLASKHVITQKSIISMRDIQSIRQADLVVVIIDEDNPDDTGTWTEIGAALAFCKAIHLLCPNKLRKTVEQNVFFFHPKVHLYDNWEKMKKTIDIKVKQHNQVYPKL